MRKLVFRAVFVLAPIACVSAIACSSTPTNTDGGPGEQLCPTNIIEATAAPDKEGTSSKCHADGYKCVVGYLCGAFVQQADCICTNGAFVCTVQNPSQQVLDQPVTDPNCTSTIPPPDGSVPSACSLCQTTTSDGGQDVCPTDKTAADGTACKNFGQQCFYTTTCTGNPPPTDVCQCVGSSTGDAGLEWKCDLNQCP